MTISRDCIRASAAAALIAGAPPAAAIGATGPNDGISSQTTNSSSESDSRELTPAWGIPCRGTHVCGPVPPPSPPRPPKCWWQCPRPPSLPPKATPDLPRPGAPGAYGYGRKPYVAEPSQSGARGSDPKTIAPGRVDAETVPSGRISLTARGGKAITLESYGGPLSLGKVALTYFGAGTSRVDIYVNGQKLGSPLNAGSFQDFRPPGYYRYRVCNYGTQTVCSAEVGAEIQR